MAILIVDDEEEGLREVIHEVLAELEPEIHQAVDGQFAVDLLGSDSERKIKMVISDIRMPRMDGIALLEWVKNNRPDVRFILVTGFAQIAESKTAAELGCDLFFLKPFNHAEMIKGVKALLVSPGAFELVDESEGEFASVEVEDFVTGKSVPFPIYLKTNTGRLIKIAHKGEDLDMARITALKEKGVHELWLSKEDVQVYAQMSERLLKAVVKSPGMSIPESRKVRLMKNAGQIIFQNLSLTGFDSETMTVAQEFLEDTVEIMTRSQSVSSLVESFAFQENSIFSHSVMCSAFAGLIGRVMGWTSRKNIFSLSVAAFFHDFGLDRDEQDLRRMSRALMTKDAFDLYSKHPAKAVQLLEPLGDVISQDIKSAILDHHESCQGNGFPQGLSVSKIFPMAKIVAMVDDFVEEFLSTPPESRKEQKAILARVVKLNPGKHDSKAIVAFIALASTQSLQAANKYYEQNEARSSELINNLLK